MMSNVSRQSRRLVQLLLASLVLLIAVPAFAGAPTDFVKKKSAELVTVINQPAGKARTDAMKKEVRALVDYEELAKRSLGKHWEARSDAEKKQFISLLEQLVELNYANRFKDKTTDKTYNVTYTDEKVRESTGQAIVKTAIKYGGDAFEIDYKLAKKSDTYTIYDVVFDDISLEETYREAYVPIIVKEGWASLVKRMEAKLKELGSR